MPEDDSSIFLETMDISFKEYLREFEFAETFKFTFQHIKGDLVGGLTSAIVALPLALGFGILAYNGDPRGAVAGLYGAIFTGFLASLFGGTQRQITGPTGGMTVILTQMYIQYGGADALLGACLIAGLLQILYGFIKAGRFISFIPYPVIVGFTNGIAILIFTQQLNLFAGAPVIGLITLAVIIAAPYVHKNLPKALIGLVVGTAVSALLYSQWDWLRVAIDPANFSLSFASSLNLIGEIPRSFSLPSFPSNDWQTWSRLFPAGLTISLLGALETLLASVVADSVTGDRHNSNRELIGQGTANFIAGLFGGIAGTGAIVRTNVNIRAGGVTKISGMFHAVVLVCVMLLFSPLVATIPLVVLAAVLMMTAIGMFEWEPLKLLPKTPRPDAIVMVATMVITVVSDLITAVLVGFALAGFLFVYRMSELGMTNMLDEKHADRLPSEQEETLRKNRIVAFDVEGPLFFGAAKNFVREIEAATDFKVVVLNMENVPVIDATGALAIEDIVDRLNRDKKKLIIAGLRKDVRSVLHRLGVTTKIGVGNFAPDLHQAIQYAVSYATGEVERMHLGKYVSQDLILLNLPVVTKEELFTKMVERANKHGYISNKAAFLDELWEREESGSTGLDKGIAVPHARSGSAGKIVIVFARLEEPIPYETLDGKPVDLVFMIAAHNENNEYLQTLSLLGRALKRPGVIEQLRHAKEAHDVFDLLAHELGTEPVTSTVRA
ncbi:MAG: PTS sugar transporter subunit IIA [Ignavibacteriae bacterium]|nr:PTS sugar transporter subunit IIA [Ignavibacteriota bacterium]